MSTHPADRSEADLHALVDLISTQVKEAISEYHTAGKNVLPLDSTDVGPFDTPQSMGLNLAKAVQIIEGACAQLCATLAPPGHSIVNKVFSYEEPSCLQVAVSARISDHLLGKPDGLHVSELSKLSGVDQGKLGRILRLLATKHVYREVQPDVYANNRLSMKLLSSDAVSGFVGCVTDEAMKASTYLWESLEDKEYGSSASPEHAAFRMAHGMHIFPYYVEHPRGKRFGERFTRCMVGFAEVTGKGVLPKVYPWKDLKPGTTLCDLGGNNGHVSLDLQKSFPHLKIVVQDLGTVQPHWQQLWFKEAPDAVQQGRAQFVGIDFFKSPPVEGCDFYYIRHVLHDWPDAECIAILKNVRTAMKPSSRVFIHEYILQSSSRSAADALAPQDVAPEPLLPNYGVGRVRPFYQDLNMMSCANAKERTLDEFVGIGREAGLSFVKMWNAGETDMLEFKLDSE